MTTRHELFKTRIEELGLYDEDSDYRGGIGRAVAMLSAVFGEQEHSGASAQVTMAVFNKLMDEYYDSESKMWTDTSMPSE